MALAAQFRNLLEACQEMEFSHLRPLVDRMFENADVALLDFAEKAESNQAQSLFFDAMNEVRRKRGQLEQFFYTELKRGFDEFPSRPRNGPPGTDASADQLTLVDPQTMETMVATQNAAGKLTSRTMHRIFALRQRLAVLNGGAAIEENQIPGGPAWLGAAYQHAVESVELDHKVRMVFIALFDKYVLGRADTLFDEFNQRLIQAEILPNLRYEVRKQAGSIEIVEKEVDNNEAEPTQPAATEEAEPLQTPSELGDELFGRICELISGRRGRGGVSATTARAGAGSVSALNPGGGCAAATSLTNPALVGQISTLQAGRQRACAEMSSDDFIENIEIDQLFIDQLQHTLSDERQKIIGAIDKKNLSAADNDIIELVGMMFEYMLMDEHLPNLVKALLSRLHTPLLKVAVIDRDFFTHQGHSARKLLNDMTAAGSRWVDESHIERGIFPKMKAIVDRVLHDFKEDVGLFDQLLEEFITAVDELNQRAQRVEQRTNEAAIGQEKLQAARNRVQQELAALMQGQAIAQAARDFLQRILADKMTFILLRAEQGDESAEWRQTVTLATRVIQSVMVSETGREHPFTQSDIASLQQQLRSATASLQQADKEKTLNALFALQNDIARGENLEQVVATLDDRAGEPPVTEAPAVEPDSAPQLQPMLKQLKTTPFGTWFEFQQPGKEKTRAKLSWRSSVTSKCMFVDQMGVKAAVISMNDLAQSLFDGEARIINNDKKPFVDRALSAIYRMLDHAA